MPKSYVVMAGFAGFDVVVPADDHTGAINAYISAITNFCAWVVIYEFQGDDVRTVRHFEKGSR